MKKKGRVENLRTPTTEEAREIGRAGGIASGEARRAKKTWKQIANIMLNNPTSPANASKLKALGIEAEDATNSAVILFKLVQKSQAGDLKATKLLAKITGNLEADKLEVNAPIKIVMSDDYGSDKDYPSTGEIGFNDNESSDGDNDND